MTGEPIVVLYGRPGCHLCDEARSVLLRVRERQPFVLRESNIEDDEALLRRFLERIPVVELDGRQIFELFVDEPELEREIVRRRGRPPGRVA